jgi:hypothetical protein
VAFKNMKGEDIISGLTPGKKLDYTDHLKDIQGLYGETTTTEDYAKNKSAALLSNPTLLDDVAQEYNIEEDEKGGYSPEKQKAIQDKYYNDVYATLKKSHDAENEARKVRAEERADKRLDIAEKRANALLTKAAKGDVKKPVVQPFRPPTGTVSKGGKTNALGIPLFKGQKVFSPTYLKGKPGPIKGAVLNDDGSFTFSILDRKDSSLNPQGMANKAAFDKQQQALIDAKQLEESDREDYTPLDTDYKYSSTKPRAVNSLKEANVIDTYLGEMINPTTGNYFTGGLNEYKQVYKGYKNSPVKSQPKKIAQKTIKDF